MDQPASPASAPLVEMRGITKRFGPNTVLRDVNLRIHASETHVLAGENGAGKSTLIKILGGVHAPDEGEILIDGETVRPRSPLHASALGVAVIHQELSLAPDMSVADNIFLGRSKTKGGWVRAADQRQASREVLAKLGLDLDVSRPVGRLPIALQQLVEIAKALSQDVRVLVMDEPTSSLSDAEADKLFALMDRLKAAGCGIVYISHKMAEIERVADRVTVLRDGLEVGTGPIERMPVAELVRLMVGRRIEEQFPRHTPQPGQPRLTLTNFGVSADDGEPPVRGVNLTLHAGEILGIAGLQGAGNSKLLHGLFGSYGKATEGQMTLDGKPTRITHPRQALDRGLALLTNDRKASGLVMPLSTIANITLADLPRLSPAGWRRPGSEKHAAEHIAQTLHLRGPSVETPVATLSGGNQQKVALGKALQIRPGVMLLDEPTRGVDIGAKREIYQLIEDWTHQGMAIVLITSEMPELLALSDRILAMHRGEVTAELTGEQRNSETVLQAAMGVTGAASAPVN